MAARAGAAHRGLEDHDGADDVTAGLVQLIDAQPASGLVVEGAIRGHQILKGRHLKMQLTPPTESEAGGMVGARAAVIEAIYREHEGGQR